MIFLTKFEAVGFKSFADPVSISFDSNTTGIIGPNGSGKSNIVDAIKWVLGEKSNKVLRGKSSTDVIFHGSKNHPASDFAKVSLHFNNKNRSINYDADHVVITRKLSRQDANNEYFINNEPCRLRDITEAFMNTGLSKGSLGIISQGTVQWFTEAKPEDRRQIFDEAAGITYYTKKKAESLSQLERTTNNLNNISNLVNELEKEFKRTEKQAEKAIIYREKNKLLTKYDLHILVKDIFFYKQKSEEIKLAIANLENTVSQNESSIIEFENNFNFAKKKLEEIENKIELLNGELENVNKQISQLEFKKHSFENSSINNLQSENLEERIAAYKDIIETHKYEINEKQKYNDKTQLEVETFTNIIKEKNLVKNEFYNQMMNINIKISDLKAQLRFMQDQANHKDNSVSVILNNRSALTGILGCVKDVIKVNDKYEKAISIALGKNMDNIIVNQESDAINAINFLKANRAGKATFMPIKTVKPRHVSLEHLNVLNSLAGYINTGSNLVEYDKKFDNVINALLGNVIIADTIENATVLSKYTYQLYRVISLDGDIIMPGGIISGGFSKKANLINASNLKQKIDEINEQIMNSQDEIINLKDRYNKVEYEIEEIKHKVNEKNSSIVRNREFIDIKQKQVSQFEADYAALLSKMKINDASEKGTTTINDVIISLNKQLDRKEKIEQELNSLKKLRVINKNNFDEYQNKMNDQNQEIFKYREEKLKMENDLLKCDNILNNAKERINVKYKMTLDFAIENFNQPLEISDDEARSQIAILEEDIRRLGNVNLEAIEELNEKQKRYEEMAKQKAELEKAKADIETIISELDKKAKKTFSEVVNNINNSLPEIFKYLFGGGSCKIAYTNEADILTSGIEIYANPPGKNILNLNLLSGGEKTLVALSILFAILKNASFPIVILDEAESALDPANVERFGNIIKNNDANTQFIIITHRQGSMEKCNTLFGATMQSKGVTSMFKVSLNQATKMAANDEGANK